VPGRHHVDVSCTFYPRRNSHSNHFLLFLTCRLRSDLCARTPSIRYIMLLSGLLLLSIVAPAFDPTHRRSRVYMRSKVSSLAAPQSEALPSSICISSAPVGGWDRASERARLLFWRISLKPRSLGLSAESDRYRPV
jgi:hypothetical protein